MADFYVTGRRGLLRLEIFSAGDDFRGNSHMQIRGWGRVLDVVPRNICGDSNRCNESVQGFRDCSDSSAATRDRGRRRSGVSTWYSNLLSTTSSTIPRYEIVSTTCLRNVSIKLSSTFPPLFRPTRVKSNDEVIPFLFVIRRASRRALSSGFLLLVRPFRFSRKEEDERERWCD